VALDWTKDIDSLAEGDLSGLSADELRILGRLAESSPIYIARALDPTATLWSPRATARRSARTSRRTPW
jgi:hypothetical protein